MLLLILRPFTRVLDDEKTRVIGRLIYGIICFATLFSFVGTILGGIWADQSWGRFWGWDPKENGALLIVLWCATMLHARWGGLVRERGLAAMAVFGNIITSFSWFGVNMLGVGLHSYGFMDQALVALYSFIGSQLAIMALALIPPRLWRAAPAAALEAPLGPKRRPAHA
jgi:cytochrome c biogenesis factor